MSVLALVSSLLWAQQSAQTEIFRNFFQPFTSFILPSYPEYPATRTAPRQPAVAAATSSVPACLLALLRCQLHLRAALQLGTRWKGSEEEEERREHTHLLPRKKKKKRKKTCHQITAVNLGFAGRGEGRPLPSHSRVKITTSCDTKSSGWGIERDQISISFALNFNRTRGQKGLSQFNVLVPEVFLIRPLKIPLILGVKKTWIIHEKYQYFKIWTNLIGLKTCLMRPCVSKRCIF